jgi:hypothetical protein
MNKRNLIPRIIVSPLMLLVMLISTLYKTFIVWISFIRYGGEVIHYSKEDPARMSEIYELLKEKL